MPLEKIVIIILLFIVVGYNGYTQHKFGIGAGINAADVSVEHAVRYADPPLKPIPGLHAGVFLDSKLSNHFHLYTELQYSQRGVQDGFFAERIKLAYLEMPILLSWQSTKWLAVEVGPQFSYLLSSKLENKIGFYSEISFNNFDVAPTGGIRLTVNEYVAFIVRYYYGLSRIADATLRDNVGASLGTVDYYYRMVQVGVRITP